jgi:hypothetical protein
MADHTYTLANKTKLPVILNLPHGVVPELASMSVVGTLDHLTTGERPLRATKRAISGSLTLCAKGTDGDKIAGLPQSVLNAPEVIAAKARDAIEIIEVESPPKEPCESMDDEIDVEAVPPTQPPAPAKANASLIGDAHKE